MAILIEYREEARMSQRDVAKKLRRAANFASVVESGERSLSVCEFVDYVRAVGGDPVEALRRIVG